MNRTADASAPPSLDRLLEHREGVFRICLGFCSSYEEAEDLAQDVYVKAAQSLGRLEKAEAAKSWLFRIAKNAGLDHRRRARRRRVLLRTWANAASPAEEETSGSTEESDPRIAGLKAAAAALPGRRSKRRPRRSDGRPNGR
jgi:RNA polymerase sigma factor (sigma-70 family)